MQNKAELQNQSQLPDNQNPKIQKTSNGNSMSQKPGEPEKFYHPEKKKLSQSYRGMFNKENRLNPIKLSECLFKKYQSFSHIFVGCSKIERRICLDELVFGIVLFSRGMLMIYWAKNFFAGLLFC